MIARKNVRNFRATWEIASANEQSKGKQEVPNETIWRLIKQEDRQKRRRVPDTYGKRLTEMTKPREINVLQIAKEKERKNTPISQRNNIKFNINY